MKEFWHEFCIQAYIKRLELWAMLLVIASWIALAELVIPKQVLDAVAYFAFGWFVLGEKIVPWTTRKLEKLFD